MSAYESIIIGLNEAIDYEKEKEMSEQLLILKLMINHYNNKKEWTLQELAHTLYMKPSKVKGFLTFLRAKSIIEYKIIEHIGYYSLKTN